MLLFNTSEENIRKVVEIDQKSDAQSLLTINIQ